MAKKEEEIPMKMNLNKLEGLAHKLSIEVPAETVRDAFDKTYKRLQKTVSLKGFRKGKAPLNIIRSHYSEKVKKDVLQNLISDSYQAALDEYSLDPICLPDIKFDNFDDDKEFAYSAEFEVRPEINLTKYEGLNIKEEKVEVDDEQVESVLKNLQANHAEEESLPEIDDDLAKKVGDFDSLDALKAQIRKDLEDSEKKSSSEDLKNQVLKALVEANPVETPKSLHERQKAMLIKEVHQRMTNQGLSEDDFEEYKSKWDEDFNQSASFVVQSSFLVDSLADKLDLRPTAKDFEAKVAEIAQQTGLEKNLLSEYYLQQKNKSRLNFQITEEKVVTHLIEKANITQDSKKSD